MSNHNQLIVRRYKIADQVYDLLKTQILKGTLASGEEISVDELARKLNTSKTPVREALNRLRGEGLVVETDRGKMSVIKLSSEEVAHICELRAALETLALKWGFQNIPQEKLQENLKMLQEAKKHLEKGDSEYFLRADSILHNLIVTSPDNPWLARVISQVRNLVEITRNMFPSLERYKTSIHEHILIVESLLRGDKDMAIKNLNSHIEHVKTKPNG